MTNPGNGVIVVTGARETAQERGDTNGLVKRKPQRNDTKSDGRDRYSRKGDRLRKLHQPDHLMFPDKREKRTAYKEGETMRVAFENQYGTIEILKVASEALIFQDDGMVYFATKDNEYSVPVQNLIQVTK